MTRLPSSANLPATPTEKVVVVASKGLHLSSLDRLRGRNIALVDPREVTPEGQLWGPELWTDDEMQKALVHAVSEGASLKAATEAFKRAPGKWPSYWMVCKWREQSAVFRRDLKIAQKMRGELMAEGALEAAMSADIDTVGIAKVQVAALQWQAQKLDRDTYGDVKSLEVKQSPEREMSDSELERRIESIRKELGLVNEAPVLDVESE